MVHVSSVLTHKPRKPLDEITVKSRKTLKCRKEKVNCLGTLGCEEHYCGELPEVSFSLPHIADGALKMPAS